MTKPTFKDIKSAKIIDIQGSNRAYAMTPEGRIFNRFSKKYLSVLRNKESNKMYVAIYLNRPKKPFKVYIEKWKKELFESTE